MILVEGLPRVLPSYPEKLSAKAQRRLERLGVEVMTNHRVTGIDAEGVDLGDERLPARTVIWAAGVAASPLARSLGVPLDRAGRVLVEPDLTIPGFREVFVVGDLAYLEQDGHPVPGVSPAAMQEARHTAANIRRQLQGLDTRPFRYLDKGNFAVIGRGAAVGDVFGKLKMSGFLAWLAWLFIHIFFLIGFRNRALVLFDWAYSFLTFRRGARLITGRGAPGGGLPPASRAAPGRRQAPSDSTILNSSDPCFNCTRGEAVQSGRRAGSAAPAGGKQARPGRVYPANVPDHLVLPGRRRRRCAHQRPAVHLDPVRSGRGRVEGERPERDSGSHGSPPRLEPRPGPSHRIRRGH